MNQKYYFTGSVCNAEQLLFTATVFDSKIEGSFKNHITYLFWMVVVI